MKEIIITSIICLTLVVLVYLGNNRKGGKNER